MSTKMARSNSVTRSAVSNNSALNNVRRSSLNGNKLPFTSSSAASNSKIPSCLTQPSISCLPSPAKMRNPRTNQPPISQRPKSSLIATTQPPRTITSPRPLTPPRHSMSSAAKPSTAVHHSSTLSRLPSQETKNIKAAKPLERSVSTVGQQLVGARPSASMSQRPATSPVTTPRRNMVTSQISENMGKSRLSSMSQSRKIGLLTDRKTLKTSVKQVPAIDQKSISRTRSKKSLEANTKQTDTQQGSEDHQRSMIFPRSNSRGLAAPRNRTEITSWSSVKIIPTGDTTSSDRAISGEGSVRLLSDIFESTRYDILMKEDARNLSWLCGDDEMSLRCPSFHRFDLPPEPFGE